MESLEPRIVLDGDPAVLLKDINTITTGSGASQFTQVSSQVFFVAENALIGKELFVSDGINPGKLLKDIVPGGVGSAPEQLTNINGQLYFTADDGIHGRELWTSDGTAAGTRMVSDLYPGEDEFGTPHSSNPFQLTPAGELFFFTAENATSGRELWLGSPTGATLIDLYPGMDGSFPNSSNPSEFVYYPTHVADDLTTLLPPGIMLAATSGTTGRELWRVDVAGNSTLVKNIHHERPGDTPKSSSPGDLTLYKGHIYFQALNGEYDEQDELQSNGLELWRSDGTAGGTVLIADINPGQIASPNGLVAASSSPAGMTVFNGKLYFAANDATNGRELWRTDGTFEGTEFFRSLRGGSASSSPADFFVVTDELFFTADNGTGRELYSTDGVDTNTGIVKDIRPGALSSNPQEFTAFGNKLLFTADDETINGRELWISDGTLGGTQIVKDIFDGRVDSNPTDLAVINGKVWFNANGFPYGPEQWRSDGTESGTQVFDVPMITNQGSAPLNLVRWGSKLAFTIADGSIWSSDGSTPGTVPLGGLTADALAAIEDKLFFVRNVDQLWVKEGNAPVLKLRYSGESLRYDPEFRGLSGGEHALEFGDAAGRF